MENLRIYRIQNKYIRYLSRADSRVQYNKDARRPYVGIVLTVGSYRYFVPMESPKPNHKMLKQSIHIMPIDGGNYGQLGFNNMIPVPQSAIIEFDITNEPDKAYAELLKRQATYINRHKADVLIEHLKLTLELQHKTKTIFLCEYAVTLSGWSTLVTIIIRTTKQKGKIKQ